MLAQNQLVLQNAADAKWGQTEVFAEKIQNYKAW